jgi:hypothetical protein
MRDANSWISRAEEYCRAEGAEKIVHPTKKYLYDLQGVGDEVRSRYSMQTVFLSSGVEIRKVPGVTVISRAASKSTPVM